MLLEELFVHVWEMVGGICAIVPRVLRRLRNRHCGPVDVQVGLVSAKAANSIPRHGAILDRKGAEHVIERSVFHYEHDDMLDSGIGHGGSLGRRRRRYIVGLGKRVF